MPAQSGKKVNRAKRKPQQQRADVAGILPLALLPCFISLFFFLSFRLGYRGVVHPPSDDEGTERTWFEPEQQPRKRVLSDQSMASD